MPLATAGLSLLNPGPLPAHLLPTEGVYQMETSPSLQPVSSSMSLSDHYKPHPLNRDEDGTKTGSLA